MVNCMVKSADGYQPVQRLTQRRLTHPGALGQLCRHQPLIRLQRLFNSACRSCPSTQSMRAMGPSAGRSGRRDGLVASVTEMVGIGSRAVLPACYGSLMWPR